eukprot:COSAG01_NODE_37838_length_498_cov_0.819549_1_plen_92_part_00
MSSLPLPRYRVLGSDRQLGGGGGVCVQVPVVQVAWCDFRGSLARTEAERRYKYDGSPQANPPVTPAAAAAAGPGDQGEPACMSEVRERWSY